MNPSGGTNTVETRLLFSVDTSKATADARRLADQVKGVGREAQQTQRDLSRMSAADRAMGGGGRGAGGTYGVQAPTGSSIAHAHADSHGMGYGIQRPAGSSIAHANYAANYRQGPPPLPQRSIAHPPPIPVAMPTSSIGTSPHAAMMVVGELTAGAGAALGLASALNTMTEALSRARYTVDPAGRPLTGWAAHGQSALQGIHDFPILGHAFGLGGRIVENMGDAGLLQHIGVKPGGLEDAQRAHHAAELFAAGAGARDDRRTALDDLFRQRRNLGFDAAASKELAGAMAGRRPEFMANLMGPNASPELVAAQMQQERAQAGFNQAKRSTAAAAADAQNAAAVVEALKQTAGAYNQPQGFGDKWQAMLSPHVKQAALNGQTEGLATRAAEAELQKALERQLKAEERQRDALIGKAEKELELERAKVDVAKARLSITDRELSKREGQGVEWGLMTGVERDNLRNILSRAKQPGGWDLISYDERQILAGSGITGEFGKDLARKAAESDVQLADILKVTGQKAMDQLKLEKKVDLDLVLNLEANDAKIREQLERQVEPIIKRIIAIVEEKFQGEVRKLQMDQGAARAQEAMRGQ